MALGDFQYSLGGVVFGTGTIYRIEDVTGFGLGDKRSKVYDIPGGNGREWGREYRNGPTITFTGEITCELDPAAAYAGMLAIRAAFDASALRLTARTTTNLAVKWPGQPERNIAGRPDKFDASLAKLVLGLIPFTATFDTAAPLVA